MQVKYANNFTFTLATGKAAGVDYFTVAYSAGPIQTFYDVFGDNPDGYFCVPITLLGSDGTTVIATGFVLRWAVTDTGNEAKVYVDATLKAAVASVGDIIACRVAQTQLDTGAGSFFRGQATLSSAGTYYLSNHGEYAFLTIAASSVNLRPRDSEFNVLPNATTGITRPFISHHSIVLHDSAGTQPAFTVTGDNYDTVKWETGTGPSFAVGYDRVHVELWLAEQYTWIGRWFRAAN